MTKWIMVLLLVTSACHAQLIGPGAINTVGKSGNLKPLVGQAAGGPPAFVRGTNSATGNPSASTRTVDIQVESGSLVAVYCGWDDADRTCTVTDSQSNPYTSIVKTNQSSQTFTELFYAKNVTGQNPLTITMTLSAAQFCRMHVMIASGCDTSSPLDKFASGSGNNTAPLTHDITTTAANEIAFVGISNFNAQTETPQASWTELSVGWDTTDGFESQYIVYSSTGTYHGGATASGTCQWAICGAWFK
jgi:hypothetical protein